METKVSKHHRDIIQKLTSGLFRDKTLEFYGVKSAKIKELVNIELPIADVSKNTMDFVFLLEDNSYLHLEFQTKFNNNDLLRFIRYDTRLFERDGRNVHTVVIYSSEVKTASASLNIGSVVYMPDIVMMDDFDGAAILAGLEAKAQADEEFSDADIINLILLPLMRNNDIPRIRLAVRSIELAQVAVKDRIKRDACIASAYAFAEKYLNSADIKRIKELLMMTDVITEIIQDERIEIAKKLLRKGLTIEFISEVTEIDESTIKQLQEELDSE